MRQATITNELVDIITGASGALHFLLSALLRRRSHPLPHAPVLPDAPLPLRSSSPRPLILTTRTSSTDALSSLSQLSKRSQWNEVGCRSWYRSEGRRKKDWGERRTKAVFCKPRRVGLPFRYELLCCEQRLCERARERRTTWPGAWAWSSTAFEGALSSCPPPTPLSRCRLSYAPLFSQVGAPANRFTHSGPSKPNWPLSNPPSSQSTPVSSSPSL